MHRSTVELHRGVLHVLFRSTRIRIRARIDIFVFVCRTAALSGIQPCASALIYRTLRLGRVITLFAHLNELTLVTSCLLLALSPNYTVALQIYLHVKRPVLPGAAQSFLLTVMFVCFFLAFPTLFSPLHDRYVLRT